MAAVIVFLVIAPMLAGVFGYVKFGALGAVLGGGAAFVVLGALIGAPFALLVQAERRKARRQEAQLAQWNAGRNPPS